GLLYHFLGINNGIFTGKYGILLICFAIMDIVISSVHVLFVQRVYATNFGYIFYGQNLVNYSEEWGFYAAMTFVIFFYQTFILLAYHYIYRCFSISHTVLHWICRCG
ncbi:hypothetical protein PFISCL1PPCAC_15317, partial [Pristionchus fissidentatus]